MKWNSVVRGAASAAWVASHLPLVSSVPSGRDTRGNELIGRDASKFVYAHFMVRINPIINPSDYHLPFTLGRNCAELYCAGLENRHGLRNGDWY